MVIIWRPENTEKSLEPQETLQQLSDVKQFL